MSAHRSNTRRVVAWLAAYLLVVQAVLTGLTFGLQAAPSDPFGLHTILCSSANSAQPDTPLDTGHPRKSDCCALGCAMFGAGIAPPVAAAWREPARPIGPVSLERDDLSVPPSSSDWSPRSTRGPPRLG